MIPNQVFKGPNRGTVAHAVLLELRHQARLGLPAEGVANNVQVVGGELATMVSEPVGGDHMRQLVADHPPMASMPGNSDERPTAQVGIAVAASGSRPASAVLDLDRGDLRPACLPPRCTEDPGNHD